MSSQAVGGFDEQFFLYGEEVDLCLRVRKAGWPIGFVQGSVVTHHGGESERGNTPVAVLEKKFNAEMRFYGKHYSDAVIRRIKRKNRVQAAWRLMTLAPLADCCFRITGRLPVNLIFIACPGTFFGR
jgi:N-acetylglucosaminyl-diphospho-decaprenol L-rhamnosyltransferase